MKKSLGAKTILYPTPVMVIGTYDKAGKPNAMTAAWGGICCSSPPCISVSLRKATYTYGNIVHQGCFTVNIPSEGQSRFADYFGVVSGRNTDKFVVTGLSPIKSTLVNAPFIEEFPLVLECKLIQTNEIGLHTQFIGEILDIKADEGVLDQNGQTDIEKIKPILYAPEANKYYGTGSFIGKAFAIGLVSKKK
ncbi:MAG TPA: flavin reductase family protein [Syntrophales bacterium]|nr:flavin reductase family protein [Syntrophales bacterium]